MRCPSCGFVNLAGSDQCDGCRGSLAAAAPKGLERRILEGTVGQLKPKKALTIGSGDTAAHAVELMQNAKVGCLLVLDGGKLAGLISERELLRNSLDPLKLSGTVGALMLADGSTLSFGDSVADTFHAMAVSGRRHLAVRLASGGYGVVSARDLLAYLCN